MAKATREENIARARRHMEARWERSAEIAESNRLEQAKRSPLTQLKRLDRRLGYDIGAKKERAKLAKKSESIHVDDQASKPRTSTSPAETRHRSDS